MSPIDRSVLDEFLLQLDGMKINKSTLGEAKKKPLLVLLILTMLKKGTLSQNKIRYADIEKRLADLITRYGGRPTESGAKPEQPFSHLRTSPFWQLTISGGIQIGNTITISKAMLLAPGSFASLHPQVFDLLRANDLARNEAINAIVERWWEKSEAAGLKSDLGIA
jgi:predicted restriction endonuclease